MTVLKFFIVFLFAFGNTNPNSGIEETRALILEKAGYELTKVLSTEEFQFELKARWIPRGLLEVGASNIKSVQIEGAVKKFTSFQVTYLSRGRSLTSNIQLQLETNQLLPVAIQRIKSGTRVSATDFELSWVPVELGKDRYVEELVRLQNKSIRRTILAGQPVREHEVSEPLMVTAGDAVNLIYSVGGIELILVCESRQSGTKGEEIRVYCPETRKKYNTEIIRSGEVQWLRTL